MCGTGSVKRVASAVGEGSIAIQLVHGLFASERVDLRATGQGSGAPDSGGAVTDGVPLAQAEPTAAIGRRG